MRRKRSITVLFWLGVSLIALGDQQSARTQPDATSAEQATRSEPPEWATLVGSAERNKYHRLTCGIAQNIKPENVIWFIGANDATENGYVAAGCNDKKCRPPAPDSGVEMGPIGGSGFPAPSLNPPEIPKMIAMTQAPAKSNTPTSAVAKAKKLASQPKAAVAKSSPPPRMAPRRDTTPTQVWQEVPPQQELAARRNWDEWAAWSLERWCERWHVAPSGKIASGAAYTPDAERQLMARFAEMKGMIDQNKKRMKELAAMIAGKKK